jgi:hypothetical protein
MLVDRIGQCFTSVAARDTEIEVMPLGLTGSDELGGERSLCEYLQKGGSNRRR